MPNPTDQPGSTMSPRNFAPGAFAGAAQAYAQFRPPYPRAMLDDMLARAALARHEALLDLATGPGRIALDLAGSFERVVAIDLEPEMIDVGRVEADRRGVANVSWLVGRAEDLELAPDSFDLVTIGEAFHRLEQPVIAGKALVWLRPGGCLVTAGSDGRFSGDEPWEIALREVRARWLERAFPDGWGLALPGQADGQEARERVLREAGFVDVQGHGFDEDIEQPFDSIVGYLASTSVCSRGALGGAFDEFEATLRSALGAEPSTRFRETVGWGYTLARKPVA